MMFDRPATRHFNTQPSCCQTSVTEHHIQSCDTCTSLQHIIDCVQEPNAMWRTNNDCLWYRSAIPTDLMTTRLRGSGVKMLALRCARALLMASLWALRGCGREAWPCLEPLGITWCGLCPNCPFHPLWPSLTVAATADAVDATWRVAHGVL